MREPIYALQRDVDMIAMQVQNLTRALTTLDWMAQKMKKLDEEQTCQGEQMRRMEEDVRVLKQGMEKIMHILGLVVKHLGIDEAL